MFVLSARRKKKELGKSEKPQTEFIRNNSYHCHSGNKKTHEHAHTRALAHTPQLPRTNTSHTPIQSKHHSSLQAHSDTHIHQQQVHFICSTAGLWMPIHKHWFTLRQHLFIYLFTHSFAYTFHVKEVPAAAAVVCFLLTREKFFFLLTYWTQKWEQSFYCYGRKCCVCVFFHQSH